MCQGDDRISRRNFLTFPLISKETCIQVHVLKTAIVEEKCLKVTCVGGPHDTMWAFNTMLQEIEHF